MVFELPEGILKDEQYQLKDLQVDVALVLYQKRKISLARAAKWLGLNRLEFQKLLAERCIPLNMTIEDFKGDVDSIQSMKS